MMLAANPSKLLRDALNVVRAPLIKHVCPFCFDYLKTTQTPFRCTNSPKNCGLKQDSVLVDKWRDNRPMGKIVPSADRFVESMACSACKHVTTKRLCPHCHQDLPSRFGEHRSYIFSVIGGRAAGKNHYLPVLIEQFLNRVGPRLGMLLEKGNDHTFNRYRESYYRYVYEDRTIIPITPSAEVDSDVKMPLLFKLTTTEKGSSSSPKIKRAVTLVFFDTAGEDLQQQEVMERVNKYIYRSDGIILLLDPLQFDRVREQLPPGTRLPAREPAADDIVTRVAELIRGGREIALNKKIDIPIAVALTKLDAVESLVDPQLRLMASPNHERGFDLEDFDGVSAEVQTLLGIWQSQFIVDQIKIQFKHCGFFGLSALGCSPDETGRIPRILPRRVEDPFLWLLYQHGFVPPYRRSIE